MDSNQIIDRLSALANDTRLEAFRVLVKHEPDGVAAGELARLVKVPQNTLSTHLAVLFRCGLVTNERHSRSIVYRANLPAVHELVLHLLQDCCDGRPELCAPLAKDISACCTTREGC